VEKEADEEIEEEAKENEGEIEVNTG